jgi:hypothetical protein
VFAVVFGKASSKKFQSMCRQSQFGRTLHMLTDDGHDDRRAILWGVTSFQAKTCSAPRSHKYLSRYSAYRVAVPYIPVPSTYNNIIFS